MQIFIVLPPGLSPGKITVEVETRDTIASIKEKIAAKHSSLPVMTQRFIYGGKQLEDNRTLSDYNIQKEAQITLLLRLRGD